VTAVDLLHHLSYSQKENFFSKAHQVLVNNGLLIIKDINDQPRFKYWFNYFHDHLLNGGTLEFFNKNLVQELAQKFHFKIIKIEYINNLFYPHIVYLLRKNE
jgi:cyclopropane fatty-acyl-phospholipid synthase-like methyltransferase